MGLFKKKKEIKSVTVTATDEITGKKLYTDKYESVDEEIEEIQDEELEEDEEIEDEEEEIKEDEEEMEDEEEEEEKNAGDSVCEVLMKAFDLDKKSANQIVSGIVSALDEKEKTDIGVKFFKKLNKNKMSLDEDIKEQRKKAMDELNEKIAKEEEQNKQLQKLFDNECFGGGK